MMNKVKTMKNVWKVLSISLFAVFLHLGTQSAAQFTTAGAETIVQETTSSNWDGNRISTTPAWEDIDQPATVILNLSNPEFQPLPGDYPNDYKDGNMEDPCPPGVSCDKKMCFEGGYCTCSEGWLPPDCEIQCPLDCASPATCIPDPTSTNKSTCACGFTSRYVPGQGCVETPTDVTVPPFKPAAFGGSNPRSRKPDPMEDELAPYEDRFCLPGFVCIHGNCSKTEKSAAGCACEPGFTGEFCEFPCELDCGLNGDCVFNRYNNTPECECHDGFIGINCTEIWIPPKKEGPGIDQTVLMLRFAAALVMLPIFLLVVVAVILYRRGNIPLMKIVYWAKPFEEDDDRRFDVFVSFASSEEDIQFVIKVLVPHLEGRMNFTVCIHQRDFLPGRYISENIVEAVKQSRRTVIIVSPSFVSSGWCKFEYQMALQEMLNEKHRVLPVILGDISSVKDKLDDTLKSILKTVTWLDYPEKTASKKDFEKFWTRLYLSLPKKRSGQLESGKRGSYFVQQGGQVYLQTLQDPKIPQGSATLTNDCAKSGGVQGTSEVRTFQIDLNDISVLDVNNVTETHYETASKRGLVDSSHM